MESALGLGAVVLFVKDMPRAVAFYQDLLGFPPVPGQGQGSDDFLILNAGGLSLALHRIPDQVAAGIEISDPPRRRSDVSVKFILVALDVAAARDEMEWLGVTVDALQEFDGVQFFDAVDPEGNVFQVSNRYGARA